MSFALDLRPPVPDALREVALQRLDRVIGELAGQRSEDPATAVHEARKDLKRLRSLVRLLRPGLTKGTYRREADALRDVSRALGARRDADALVETVERLRGPASGRVPAATLDALAGVLSERTEGEAPAGAAAAHEDELAALRAVRERIADGALTVDGRTTLAAGLARSYDRAHAAFWDLGDDPDAEALHEWRKRVKDLWYQQQLLTPVWPAVLKAQSAEAKALSKLLGDDHDLHALTALVADPEGPARRVAADTDELLPLLESRRAELLVASRAYGVRLHAERPKAFRRRIRRYLDAPPLQG